MVVSRRVCRVFLRDATPLRPLFIYFLATSNIYFILCSEIMHTWPHFLLIILYIHTENLIHIHIKYNHTFIIPNFHGYWKKFIFSFLLKLIIYCIH